MKKILPYIIILVVGMVIGWLCRNHFRGEVKMVEKVDTLVFRDTVKEYHPVEIRKEVVDTMLVVIRDTIRVKDTLYLSIPLEKKVYASDEYYAEVSGYRPHLDCIEVFPKTKVITKSIQPVTRRNALSIGIETSYMNTLSTPIYLEYERMLHKNVGIYGQVFCDLPTRRMGAGLGVKAQMEW